MSRKIKTLDSLKKDNNEPEDHSSDEDRQQSFYVGGGEHSGQQVLGGSDGRGDIVSNLLRAAERHGARPVAAEEEAESSSSAKAEGQFPVAGHRLGDLVRPSEQINLGDVEGDDDDVQVEVQHVMLRMWTNGFSLDDGPLRAYDDPANTAFLNDIMRRVTPKELLQQYRGKEIDLHIEKKDTPFALPKAIPKPFSGQGQRLGEIEPIISGSGKVGVKYDSQSAKPNSATKRISEDDVKKAQETVQMHGEEPVTQVQLRLPDGQRLIGRFSHTHTLEDVRSFVVSAIPELAFKPFTFMSSYPKKVIDLENLTLADAGLLNSVILINFV